MKSLRPVIALLIAACLIVAACESDAPSSPTATATPPTREPTAPLVSAPSPSPSPSPTATAAPAPTPTQSPPPFIPIPSPPRGDPREIAARLRLKQERPIPPLPRRETDYQTGREETFNILDLDGRKSFTIDAELRFVSPNAYFYVQKGRSVSGQSLEQSARELEEKIIPAVKRLANPSWQPGAGLDSRISILHGDIPGLAGYFNPLDELPKEVNRFTNQRPMVYINVALIVPGTPQYFATLTHELQHAAQAQADPNEESWIQEGASEYLAEAAGYPVSLYPFFLRQPDTQLTTWADELSNTGANYGAAHLFMRYLAKRFGPEAIIALVTDPKQSVESVNAFLRTRGVAGGLDEVMIDFAVQNYLDPAYGRSTISVGGAQEVAIAQRIAQAGSYRGQVRQYAADYIEIAPLQAESRLTIEAPAVTPLLPLTPPSGRFVWWSNRGDNIDSKLTAQFDLTRVTQATLQLKLWYDLERLYDYAYVMASKDGGKTWEILQGRHTTAEDPIGQSFGHGYTGRSGGGQQAAWVDESIDLSAYAGRTILLRFELVGDGGINNHGFAIDDIRIAAVNFSDDVESPGNWQAEGFVRTDNRVPQRLAARLIALGERRTVLDIALDDQNRGGIFLAPGVRYILVIVATAPATSVPVEYAYTVR
ncbi:MAG: hypothetical protein FJ039_04040 [Chloroflexi bacterium]|nr:hypothetical protein [Chloroflexota bacterium]